MSDNKSSSSPSLIPFNYVLIMALSCCGFWLLNIVLLEFVKGGFLISILISLVLTGLFWLPWLRMYMQSNRPDKRIMKPLFPHYFWSSLLGVTATVATILGFMLTELESEFNLIQHTSQLIFAMHLIWFWYWSFQQFYRYSESESHSE